MTTLNRDEIREKIESELLKVEEEIKELEKNSKPITPDCTLDDIGRAEAMNEVRVQAKILEQVKQRKKNLNYALTNLEDENFGVCIVCGETINAERILVRPESVRCIKCAD